MKRIIPLLLVLLFAGTVVLFTLRPEPQALNTYRIDPVSPYSGEWPTVQFLGNTNLLFSDGESTFMTDAFFSRPAAHNVLLGKVQPNRVRIERCLEKAGISQLDAVIPLHSHFDHAMDAALVSDLTGAVLIGSQSTLNIGRGYGLSEESMLEPILNQPMAIGKFSVTFIQSRHWQYPNKRQRSRLLDQDIEQPLPTPASIYEYKEGITYTLLITYDSLRWAIQGSAGFIENSIEDFDADVLFLAIAGIEVMDEAYNKGYQEHLVEALQPEILVPIHWDDFTLPLSKGLKTTNMLFNWRFGSDLGKAFRIIEANNTAAGRSIKILPLWKKVSAHDLIQRP